MKKGILLILSLLVVQMVNSDPNGILYLNIYLNDTLNLKESDKSFTNYQANLIRSELSLASKKNYLVQLGAFRLKSNAEALYRKIAAVIGEDVRIIEEDGYFKVRVSRQSSRNKISYLTSWIPDQINQDPGQETRTEDDINKPEIPASDTMILSASVADSTFFFRLFNDSSRFAQQTQEIMRKFIFLNTESPWLKRVNYFGKSFAFVNALILTIMISIATMLILLMIILLNRTSMEKREQLRQYLSETYQSMIIDYLFYDTDPEKFRSIASDTFRRQVLIDQMIDVSVNLKGDAEKKLTALYKHLGLDRDSINRAKDHRWHKKIKGFRELAFMEIKDANSEIFKALNSRNDILRMEAQIALVRLSDENPFEFLSYLTSPFSLWEQITLHELIIQHDLPVPQFKKWLTSSNPTVVMFALRMIKQFDQIEAENDVRETLSHPSQDVRHLAVQVAGDLNMRSTLEVMKRMYKNQDLKTCLEIIKAIGKMPDPSIMSFLKLVLDKEDDVQLQIEATKAIENHGEEGVRALVRLMKSEYKNYNIIVRHVLDRRIY
jgi:hypothetical protein